MNRTSVPSTWYLEGGQRLRIRMPRATDRERLADLVARTGRQADPLEAARLLRLDPRAYSMLVAGVWTGTTSVIVGFAATERGTGAPPQVLIGDEELAPGVSAALCEVLDANAVVRGDRAA